MNNIPDALKKELLSDPEYTRCSLKGYHICGGRITLEHAIIYAGKQVQERWAIIPVCAAGQEVDAFQDAGTMDKWMNRWVALNRATDEELSKYYKATPSFQFQRDRLNQNYGAYVAPEIPADALPPPVLPKGKSSAPRPHRRELTNEEYFEREIRIYSRENRVSPEEARVTLAALV